MSDRKDRPDASRRRFLGGLTAAGSSLLLPGCSSDSPGGSAAAAPGALPDPAASGIDHIVVVMMENRSFDHFLGWVPGADGRQAGLRYPDKSGQLIDTFHLAPHAEYGYQGCGKEDPDHGYEGGRVHFNNGRLDGWLGTVGDASVGSDHFPVGYYTADDLPFFKGVAQNFTLCDRYFHSILASTFPNRVYLHAGETDRRSNTLPPQQISSLPTIWDRCADAGVSAQYYFHDLPVTGLWGPRYLDISTRFEQFLIEAAAGVLPSISIVDPRFVGEAPNGITNDDHPQADVRNGQAFLNSVYDAMRNGPQWERSLLVICYDEWGGFFDHVEPPFAPVSEAEAALPNDGRLGFRVPAAIIGPRARRGHVSHHQFDTNSILNLLCWRFGLEPLGVRAATSLNMAHALDFERAPNVEAPDFGVPLGPFGVECSSGLPNPIPTLPGSLPGLGLPLPKVSAALRQAHHNQEWLELRDLARRHGFDV